MSDYKEVYEAVDEAIDAVQESDWSVETHDVEIDDYDGAKLHIDAEYEITEHDVDLIQTDQSKEQRERIRSIKEVVKDRERKGENGAEVAAVINEATNWEGTDEEAVRYELDKLKTQGEVYEPTTDHLRTTY